MAYPVQRHPELGVDHLVNTMEGRRSYAHYGKCVAGKRDRLTHDFRIAVKAASPEVRAQHNDRLMLFAAYKAAPVQHTQLSHVEEIYCDRLTIHVFRLSAAADGGGQKRKVACYTGEGFRLLAKIDVLQPRKCREAEVSLLQRQQRGWIADRRGTENEPVDQGKDGGVRADAQGDREHRDGRNTRMFA